VKSNKTQTDIFTQRVKYRGTCDLLAIISRSHSQPFGIEVNVQCLC